MWGSFAGGGLIFPCAFERFQAGQQLLRNFFARFTLTFRPRLFRLELSRLDLALHEKYFCSPVHFSLLKFLSMLPSQSEGKEKGKGKGKGGKGRDRDGGGGRGGFENFDRDNNPFSRGGDGGRDGRDNFRSKADDDDGWRGGANRGGGGGRDRESGR